jgi:rubrerythrin
MADRSEDAGFFAIIPATVRYDKSIPQGAKLLYAEITALAKKKGYCWASNEYFANLYDTSERTIIRWVQSLNQAGHIDIHFKYFPDSKKIEKRYLMLPKPIAKKAATKSMSTMDQDLEDSVVTKMSPPEGLVVTKMSLPSGDKNSLDTSKAYKSKAAAADQSFPEIEKPPPETAAAENSAQEIQKLKSHFSSLSRVLLFDEWFYPEILKHLSKNKLGFDFVSWMHKYCIRQEPQKIAGYFFKVFLQPRFVELYRAEGPPLAPARPHETVSCPVCGAVHLDSDEFCPQCKFLSSSLADQEEIHYFKTLFLMPPEMREQYDAECDQILKGNKNFKEIETHRLNLDKKYGLMLGSA